MQDDSSYQALSENIDSEVGNVIGLEDEDMIMPRANTVKLLTVMSQREMETLTSWFPKTAATLARVLRSRSHRIDDEL